MNHMRLHLLLVSSDSDAARARLLGGVLPLDLLGKCHEDSLYIEALLFLGGTQSIHKRTGGTLAVTITNVGRADL